MTANDILKVVRQINGAADARAEQVTGLPTLSVIPERTALGRYGLNVVELQEWVSAAIGGESAGILYEGDRRFELVVRLPETLRRDLDRLAYLPVPLPNGDYVPLNETLGGRRGVFIKEDDKYEFTPLILGRQDGRFYEVIDGMAKNQAYVVKNSYLIKADIEKSEAEHDH
jgi:hypothetical protein